MISMKKVELLCPVGNKDMLYQAIHNGADAVYLSGKRFGARKFANNFSDSELISAIEYSHLYGVKVYVTVNTMIYMSEVSSVMDYLKFLYINGVDAVIMQDIGLIKLAREKISGLEIHASTQCHNHNKEQISLLKDMGVTRVVMAREMSLNEIKSIDVDIEKEVFVYGALCVCYSGCCLFSSMNGGRSGNRGECVGSCRLPYKLMCDDKEIDCEDEYLLSTRDLNTLDKLPLLIESGIDSLKIEGRMKSPYYVGYVTKVYRRLIDAYYNGDDCNVTTKELTNLKKLFNRKYTLGYLFNEKSIMNRKSPNHLGVNIGKVIKCDKRKIYIKLDSDSLNQEDGIRFVNSNKGMMINRLYNDKYLLVNHIPCGSICILDNKFGYIFKSGEIISKTIDSTLIKEISNVCEKVINVSYKVYAKKGEKLCISISDGDNTYSVYGNIVEDSINRCISASDIENKLSKLGNTPYRCNDIEMDIDDNIFIPISEINNIRRELTDNLSLIRKNILKRADFDLKLDDNNINRSVSTIKNISVLVRNEEQLESILKYNIKDIYTPDYDLYIKYKDKYNNIYYRTKRVNNCKYNYNNDNLLVCELGGINKYSKNNNVISDYFLNVSNSYSVDFLSSLGVEKVSLSVEIDDYEIENIAKASKSELEIIIYGRIEVMIMKYCPLSEIINNCRVCKSNKNSYYLKSTDNKLYPIIHSDCYTSIMNSSNTDKIANINSYLKMGINNFRIELFDESSEDIDKIFKRL